MTYEKRKYQEEAIQACTDAFADRGLNSVMLESPVGSGKTYMALETIHRFQERLGRKLKINWVAPRHHLLRQMMEANADLHGDCIRPVSLFDRNPPQAEFVVLDEAHHEATQSCVMLYERMANHWTLGLSATPLRTDRMKLSFQDSVRTCSIARLIREGFLSPFNSYMLQHYTVEEVARQYLATPERWGKSLVYFRTIAECLEFRRLLAEGGVACEVVTSESDKELQIERFADGRVQVVANVAMLTEGFDLPDVKSVFARDASRLPTIQMCGRGLRLAPGKEACNIVQGSDTMYSIERLAAAKNSFRYQRGHWLALKDGTQEIEEQLQETLKRMAARQKDDRRRRKREYQVAERQAGEYFRSKLRRLDQAEKLKRDYYAKHAPAYDAVYRLIAFINRECWGGNLPLVAVHFAKGTNLEGAICSFVRDMVHTENQTLPGIDFHLGNCTVTMSVRRFALHLMLQLGRLKLLADGREPVEGAALDAVMYHIGMRDGCHAFVGSSHAGEVFREVDANYANLPKLLACASISSFSGTEEGDQELFLSRLNRGLDS